MATLPSAVLKQVQTLCDEGDELADEAQYDPALVKYWAAWAMLPEPKTSHEAAMWVLGAIGDVHYLCGDYSAGRDTLAKAMQCPGAIGDAILHLRLGQCEFELGNLDQAADELHRAYIETGGKVFDEEEDRYFEFLKSRKPAPDGGW